MKKETIKKFVDETIRGNEKAFIYIIKGIEFLNLKIDYPKLISDTIFSKFILNELNTKELLQQLTNKINNDDTGGYLLYSEFLIINELKLLGVLDSFGKKYMIIDFNFFGNMYSSFGEVMNQKSYYELFESDKDNNLQAIFSLITNEIDQIVYSYQDTNLSCELRRWRDYQANNNEYLNTEENCADNQIVLSGIMDKVELVVNTVRLDHQQKPIFYALTSDMMNADFLKHIISSINKLNIKTFKTTPQPIMAQDSKKYNYVKILKRINPTYEFKNIPIYENPALTKKIIQISQEVIINDIYENALKAKANEYFNDIFVTASTGAGKSVMFQIPAIKLFEEYGLVTIIITPLIGLMNDQVRNIEKMTSQGTTLNSEYTPYEKERIKENITLGKKSIIYISPETLLSNYDLSSIIGDRKVGLMIIDEAHTVATWGKSFRPDYWYLGDYLRRLRKDQTHGIFPIVALTATATYGGVDDMYYDIVDSLFLNINKPYIGKVKRDNIEFLINNKKKTRDYAMEKKGIAIERISYYLGIKEKTLVYFPYRKTVIDIYRNLSPAHKNFVGKYMGDLAKIEKDETLEDFRNGKKTMVLATKAFGMGIDINDIKNVYHFAPTGNLADYVQEIGRVARKKEIIGKAITDFYTEDFRYIKQLFGMSSIKNFEVVGVVQKILDIYERKNTRNFLVSPEEFAHVFNWNMLDDVDNRLKTTLLIIKKDLEYTQSSFALIFKPRSMFTKGIFLIKDVDLAYFKQIKWTEFLSIHMDKDYLKHRRGNHDITYLGDLYELDFKKLWETRYQELTFGNFKRLLFENKLDKIDLKNKLISKIVLEIETKNNLSFDDAFQSTKKLLDLFSDTLDYFKAKATHFDIIEFAEILFENPNSDALFKSKTQCQLVVNSVLYLLNNMGFQKSFGSHRFLAFNSQTNKYTVESTLYKNKISILIKSMYGSFRDYKTQSRCVFIENNQNDTNKDNKNIIIAQIFELINVAEYSIRAGERPEFFVRVNSEIKLREFLTPYFESNTISKIKKRHELSIRIMDYFFTRLKTDSDRWDLIESYFLGENIFKDEDENEEVSYDS